MQESVAAISHQQNISAKNDMQHVTCEVLHLELLRSLKSIAKIITVGCILVVTSAVQPAIMVNMDSMSIKVEPSLTAMAVSTVLLPTHRVTFQTGQTMERPVELSCMAITTILIGISLFSASNCLSVALLTG